MGERESGERGSGGAGEKEMKRDIFSPDLPLSPLPVSVILSPKLLMKTGVGSFYPCSIEGPDRGPIAGH